MQPKAYQPIDSSNIQLSVTWLRSPTRNQGFKNAEMKRKKEIFFSTVAGQHAWLIQNWRYKQLGVTFSFRQFGRMNIASKSDRFLTWMKSRTLHKMPGEPEGDNGIWSSLHNEPASYPYPSRTWRAEMIVQGADMAEKALGLSHIRNEKAEEGLHEYGIRLPTL